MWGGAGVSVGDPGLFKSTDGAGSWSEANIGLAANGAAPTVNALAIDPVTPTTIYAGTDSGMFKSTDGAGSWSAANTGLPAPMDIQALAIDPSTPTTLYAVNYGNVFKSTNGGGSWSALNNGLAPGFQQLLILALAIDPTTPTTLYAGTYGAVLESTDGGGSWSATNVGMAGLWVQALAFDSSGLNLFAGTPGGVFSTVTGQSIAQTTIALALSANPSALDQSVTLTATVTSGSGTPTGPVLFMDGTNPLQTVLLNAGVASVYVPTVAIGSHTITATYQPGYMGFAGSTASVNQIVLAGSSTAVGSSLNPSVLSQSVTFTATVTSSGGTPTGTVTFYDGMTSLGAGALNANGVATCATAALAIGLHSITASYGGDTNFASSLSPAITQVVNGPRVILSTSGLSFNNQPLGTTSAASPVTVSNNGTASLTFTSVAITGDFALASGTTCSTSAPVAAGGSSCVINVTFTPTATGSRSGSLTLTDYASGSPQIVGLSGTGTPAPLVITASSGSMTYGVTAPTITPSYSGFVNGDTSASLITQPICSTTATSHSPAGSYPSSCSGAVDSNYSISYVSGTVTDSAAALAITASSGSMTYGGTVPTITSSYSGFVNGDTSASLTTQPTCSTTATSRSAAGSYPASCSGAVDSNYTISYVNGTVTNSTAALAITANNATRAYGAANPNFTATYSGFVSGDMASGLTGTLTCTTTAAAGSLPGTYPITCSGQSSANYNITSSAGTLTVTAAPLTITASSGSMTYGGTPPTVTPSYSGFVNGDTLASLASAPTCTTTATSSTPVGTDTGADTCSGAVDGNYTITYVPGNVTESKPSLTITASSGSMTYGGTPPTVTPSYSRFVNGDTVASLTTAPTCTTTATSSTPAGMDTAADTCSGAVDPNYSFTYVAGSVTVNQATPVITWTPAPITYGTALSSTQLNATASVPGTFVYSPAAGTTPATGTDTLSATFTPIDTTDYTTAMQTVSLTVSKVTPVITWTTPAAITDGTTLSSTQLNATASVIGTFVYGPAAGTTPAAGTDTLSVTFTPTDTADYNTATATVTLAVADFTFAPPSGSSTSASVAPGQPATYTLSVGGEGGLSGTVTFTCTGAPSEATCTVSPNPATAGSSATNVTVAVTTTAASVGAPRTRRLPPVPPLLPDLRGLLMVALALAAMAWAIRRQKQPGVSRWRSTIVLLASGLLLTLALAGCGGGNGSGGSGGAAPSQGTPAGAYTLTVTGTTGSGSATLSHSVTLTLKVS